ncbi:MAG: low temperature requirement protein A [Micromonosporaceae bacterium]|nr:low temperature requirement protein A [Micromonosporaceae bacterium]
MAPGAKVTWPELFYDLVFAYAFVNVTLTTTSDLDDRVGTLLLVLLLWHLWISFVSLGNIVRGDEGPMPFATLISVGATFLAALDIPNANGPRPHRADFLFAACYTVVRAAQALLLWDRVRREPHPRPRALVVVGPTIVNSALLFAAAGLPRILPSHIFLIHWTLLGLAVVVAYGALIFLSFPELERISVRHWADRFGQIILIALGEPIIALGRAHHLAQSLPPSAPLIGTGALSVAIVAAMAVAYFDTRMIGGEHALRRAKGGKQVALARDAYILLHLPMIIGILLFSLGLRNVVAAVAAPAPAGSAGLQTTLLLYGGDFVYLAALVGFQLRTGQPVTKYEIAIRPPLLLAIPLVAGLPAIVTLTLLTTYTVANTVVRYVRGRPLRSQLRAAARAAHRAMEAAEAYEHGREDEPRPG